MDWAKVDAALAGALADAGDPDARVLPVFIDLDPEAADPGVLAALHLEPPAGGGVCTATLSAGEVDRLTDHAWVTRLRLSGSLGLLGPG